MFIIKKKNSKSLHYCAAQETDQMISLLSSSFASCSSTRTCSSCSLSSLLCCFLLQCFSISEVIHTTNQPNKSNHQQSRIQDQFKSKQNLLVGFVFTFHGVAPASIRRQHSFLFLQHEPRLFHGHALSDFHVRFRHQIIKNLESKKSNKLCLL